MKWTQCGQKAPNRSTFNTEPKASMRRRRVSGSLILENETLMFKHWITEQQLFNLEKKEIYIYLYSASWWSILMSENAENLTSSRSLNLLLVYKKQQKQSDLYKHTSSYITEGSCNVVSRNIDGNQLLYRTKHLYKAFIEDFYYKNCAQVKSQTITLKLELVI